MVVTCEISFDNNRHGTFYAGQLVSGCVTLKCDRPKEIQGKNFPQTLIPSKIELDQTVL